MSKELLDREKKYMEFVDECGDNVLFWDNKDLFKKSLFIRICASQQNIKNIYLNGYKDRLLRASKKGGAYFFSEVVAIEFKIPRIVALFAVKINFIFILVKSLTRYSSNKEIARYKLFDNKVILISNLERLTKRFTEFVDEYNNLFEVHVDGVVDVYACGHNKINSFYLPRITIRQFIIILLSPAWESTFLTRALRLKNLIQKLGFTEVYIMDGDAPSHVSAAYAARLLSVPSIGVQWGGMPVSVKPGYKSFPFDRFYCAGKFYVDLLRSFSDHTRFTVKRRITKINPDELSKSRANSFLFLLSDCRTIITKNESDELIEICIETKRLHPDLNITARPHPRMILAESVIEKLRAMNITVDRTQGADTAMASHKYIIGHVSSMMVECLEYDCFPLFYEIGLADLQPELIKLSAAKIFKTKDEWFGLLDELIKDYDGYSPPSDLKESLFGYA